MADDQKMSEEVDVVAEREAQDILKAMNKEELEFNQKYTALIDEECEKVQKEIDRIVELNKEVDQQFEKMFREKIAEGLHRNKCLHKMECGIKTVSDWMDEILSKVDETKPKSTMIQKNSSLESEIEELTTKIAHLNDPEYISSQKERLEKEMEEAFKALQEARRERDALQFEMELERSKKKQLKASLETIFAEQLAELGLTEAELDFKFK